MSFLAAMRGASGGTGANITFIFPTGNIDTTTLQPGQAFDLRTYLFNQNIIRSLDVTTRLNIIIPSGCTLGSSDSTKPAITIQNFKNRDRIIITNNGNIYGAGGSGGLGGNQSNGNKGGKGGTALNILNTCFIINNSTGIIKGGQGGQGGAGGITNQTDISQFGCQGISSFCFNGYPCPDGGGCGAKTCGDSSALNCINSRSCYSIRSNHCTDRTYTYSTGGTGSSGTAGRGINGVNGNDNNNTGGAGGDAGIDINGNSFVTLTNTGTTANNYVS